MKIQVHVSVKKCRIKENRGKRILQYVIQLQPLLIVLIPYFISLAQYILHLQK